MLFARLESGKSLREVARSLRRSHTSLSRELKRNAKYGKPYIPCKADEKSARRSIEQRSKAPLKDPLVFLYVREHLRMGWSPEQIAGRLPIDVSGYSLDTESIYRHIYRVENRRACLWEYLTYRRRKRMRQNGRSVKRLGKIPNAVSIDLRPKEANERFDIGHWETDNVQGKQKDKTALSVSTERVTRLAILDKLPDRTAEAKLLSVSSRMLELPKMARLTITADNGSENTNHEEISNTLSVQVYFCHSYCSWEKGTVENTAGRIRRFIPKGESIDEIPEEVVRNLEVRLNTTPRKCLGFMTPYEKMEELLHQEMVESYH